MVKVTRDCAQCRSIVRGGAGVAASFTAAVACAWHLTHVLRTVGHAALGLNWPTQLKGCSRRQQVALASGHHTTAK